MAGHLERAAAPRDPAAPPRRCHVLVFLPDQGVFRPAALSELSPEGLWVLINRPVAQGTVLLVRLRRADGRLTLMRNARVRYATRTPAGIYGLGLAFDRPLTPYAVESLGGRRGPVAAPGPAGTGAEALAGTNV